MQIKMEFYYPRRLVFGSGCLAKMSAELSERGLKRLFILTIPVLKNQIVNALADGEGKEFSIRFNFEITAEPRFSDLERVLNDAKDYKADCIIGVGGGSILDVAKVVAAQLHSGQTLHQIAGIGLLKSRKTYLICAPTTSGTGSEVSPNALLVDESDGSKKGIISPYLVPDAAYVDPGLTVGLPPYVTAFTGIDALTHCIEAFANRFADPMTDLIALEGIRLIGAYLKKAVIDGEDVTARTKVALGSLYGGMCLGPVNTAAVHALAYPLGTDFKIPHGVSNALLLPYVIEYNLHGALSKYAEIAVALGVTKTDSLEQTALLGINVIRNLIIECGLPSALSELKIPENAIESMSKSAFKIQRLLKNNVRELTEEDIYKIYINAYKN